jgi:hypothetical protein
MADTRVALGMPTPRVSDFDRRDLDWYIDKAIGALVFVCGFSAIIFVLGIFLFVTKEGIGFIFERLDFREFFLTPYWFPSDPDAPEYGILALDRRYRQRHGPGDAGGHPLFAGGRHLHRGIRDRQDPRGPQGAGGIAGRHSLRGLGLYRPGHHESLDHLRYSMSPSGSMSSTRASSSA